MHFKRKMLQADKPVQKEQLNSLIILGGSFNPVHYGHLRLAVEVCEALAPDRLDFVPVASPAHKPGLGLLPFEMRVQALREICAHYPLFHVNTLEAEREGPSYTCDTLAEYRRRYPGANLYFVMGSEDFMVLDGWHSWSTLPDSADLLVVPRQGVEEEEFIENVFRLWPEAVQEESPHAPVRTAFRVHGGRVLYMPLPRLDINSSLVRRRWLAGRKIDFWVPPEVISGLTAQDEVVVGHWK